MDNKNTLFLVSFPFFAFSFKAPYFLLETEIFIDYVKNWEKLFLT